MKKYDLIIASGATICYNKLAKDFTHIKTGGKIDTLIMPNTIDNLVVALQNTENAIVLGGTTNSLISDNGLNDIVILTTNVRGLQVKDNIITANAGESLAKVCAVAKDNSLSGMEQLSGIPGTVGGAVNMNAGAYGRFMSDVVDHITCYTNGKIITLSNSECEFMYRTSGIAKNNLIVLSVAFKLTEKNQILISNDMKYYKDKRRQSQPSDLSLGSVFKKYDNIGAGYNFDEYLYIIGAWIDHIQLWSHANFIINKGLATSKDYANLVTLCQNKVYDKYNIKLEREVKYFGEFIF